MAIALPASIIDGLLNGPSPSIPTPVGQLKPCYSIDSCLRKLSHWYYQDCFSPAQVKEQVRIVICKPLLEHQSRELKRTDGYGGYANFHNCAFTGFSWCGIVNSDTSPDGDHYWRLPVPCRSTAIVLALPLTAEELASLTHGGSYRGYIRLKLTIGIATFQLLCKACKDCLPLHYIAFRQRKRGSIERGAQD